MSAAFPALMSDPLADLEQDGLQVRSAPAAGFQVSEGEFQGMAVPYGYKAELAPGLFEVFERGAFARASKDPARVKVTLGHGQVIGRALALEDREAGLWIHGKIVDDPDLPDGRRALAMLRTGLADELSVGFVTVKGGSATSEVPGGVLVSHRRAALREVAVAPWGAYGRGARVTQVRDERAAQLEAAWRSEWAAKFAELKK